MFITKKHLSRRTVLRGMGVGIALPLLDAMCPAAVAWADTPAKTPQRLAFVGFPHGAVMRLWSPEQSGKDYTMSRILDPLAKYRDSMTIVSGLRNKPAESSEPHERIERTWLSCVAPEHSGVDSPDAGVTADQLAVRHIGQETKLPSLELTTAQIGAQLSWRTPTQSLPQEINPRNVFYRLFGQGDTDAERAAIVKETGSILDRVTAQAHRLQGTLAAPDRVAVNDYLDSVREIERRLQLSAEKDTTGLAIPDAPIGVPGNFDDHFKLMFDLMALAFQADVTRIVTFSMDREASMRTYNNLSIQEAFHPLSHHGEKEDAFEKLLRIQSYHSTRMAKFVERLKSMKEGNGTLLDSAVILYGSNMANSDRHNNDPLPQVIVGHGGGIRGGQHLHYPQDTPHANILATVLQKVGAPVENFPLSTGVLTEV